MPFDYTSGSPPLIAEISFYVVYFFIIWAFHYIQKEKGDWILEKIETAVRKFVYITPALF